MQHLQSNTTLQGGKYKIEKLLGQGGFGITYLAEQSLLKIKVAIKEFFIRDLCDRGDTANVHTITQADMVERYRKKFFKEAQILARLKHHGIVHVTDIFEENGTAYYVMEYVEGESLADIIKRNGPLPEQTALRYISKVAEALDYIHHQNVNHLDIKPSNIMIRQKDDEPILIDFGVSKQYDEQKDQTTTTPPGVSNGYSPLEQYKPGGVSTFSPQADIYALGATLYKLLTSNTPPNASDMLNDGLPPMPSNISHNVRSAIEKAMQPRRDDRPESVKEWMQILSAATDSEETKIISSMGNEETIILGNEVVIDNSLQDENEKKRTFYWWYILLGVLLLAGIGIYYSHEASKPEQNKSSEVVIDNEFSNEPSTTENVPNSTEIKDETTNSADVSAIEDYQDVTVNLPPNNHLDLKGSFYNQKHSWPVEFSIQIDNEGQINGVYKNISQKVRMKIAGQSYADGSLELYDRNGNLYVHLNKNNLNEYSGEATSGQTTLGVTLNE